jgi:type II secretory pathway pseudopilin PulG
MKAARAFTIIEISAVIIIIAAAGLVAVFHIHNNMNRVRLVDAGQKLLAVARQAQISACYQHRLCRLRLNPADNTVQLESKSFGVPVEIKPAEAPVKNHDASVAFWILPEGVHFGRIIMDSQSSPFANGESVITFYPDGTSDAAAIQLTARENTVTLLIYPHTGQAWLHDGLFETLPQDSLEIDSAERNTSG